MENVPFRSQICGVTRFLVFKLYSLYIGGSPGTGKTALLREIEREFTETQSNEEKFQSEVMEEIM